MGIIDRGGPARFDDVNPYDLEAWKRPPTPIPEWAGERQEVLRLTRENMQLRESLAQAINNTATVHPLHEALCRVEPEIPPRKRWLLRLSLGAFFAVVLVTLLDPSLGRTGPWFWVGFLGWVIGMLTEKGISWISRWTR